MSLKVDFYNYIVVDVFIHNVVKLHGIPKNFINDRDEVFISKI